GAELDRDGDGPILSTNQEAGIFASGGTLTVTQSTVSNNQASGISTSGGTLTVAESTVSTNQEAGIFASGGTLTVTQSTVSTNHAGGILVTGPEATFTITNNFIVRNGNSTTANVGGASLAQGASNVFAFNTVVDNQIQNTTQSA